MVPSELQILVLFYDQGGTHLFARTMTTHPTQQVGDWCVEEVDRSVFLREQALTQG
jgi:hypothetical protein